MQDLRESNLRLSYRAAFCFFNLRIFISLLQKMEKGNRRVQYLVTLSGEYFIFEICFSSHLRLEKLLLGGMP